MARIVDPRGLASPENDEHALPGDPVPAKRSTGLSAVFEDRTAAEWRLTTAVLDEITRVIREAGVTQKELAARTGIDTGNISKTLAGRHTPSLLTIARMLHALGHRLEVRAVPNTNHDTETNVTHPDTTTPQWLTRITAGLCPRDGHPQLAHIPNPLGAQQYALTPDSAGPREIRSAAGTPDWPPSCSDCDASWRMASDGDLEVWVWEWTPESFKHPWRGVVRRMSPDAVTGEEVLVDQLAQAREQFEQGRT